MYQYYSGQHTMPLEGAHGLSSLNQIREWAAQKQDIDPRVLGVTTPTYALPSFDNGYAQPSNINDAMMRLQYLTVQNRLLKAQQQNLMVKQQIAAVTAQRLSQIRAQEWRNRDYDNNNFFDGDKNPLNSVPVQASQEPNQQRYIASYEDRRPKPENQLSKFNDEEIPNSYLESEQNSVIEGIIKSKIPSPPSEPKSTQVTQQPQSLKEEIIQPQTQLQPASKAPSRVLPPTYRRKLGDLSSTLASLVEENDNVLTKEKTEQLSKIDIKKQKSRDEQKKVAESIAMHNNSHSLAIMPRWRHHLLGNMNPPTEAIMKPKSLFRAVAYGIITAIIAPERAVTHAKHLRKEKETRDFARSLRIILENFSDWLSKPIALPLSSIVEDGSMDFDVKEWTANRNKFIPFKVRFKAILQGLFSSAMPNATTSNFLVLFMSDDNYFPDDFFWSFEQRLMQYNRLGGTRDVIPIYEHEEELLNLPGMTQQVVKQITTDDDDKSIRYAGILRLRMLLIDVLLVRIIITKLILSPWHYGVCRQPINRNVRRAVSNLRVMATIFYQLARRLNPSLPAPQIVAVNNGNDVGKAASTSSAGANESAAKGTTSVKPSELKLPPISAKKTSANSSANSDSKPAAEENGENSSTEEKDKPKAAKAPTGFVGSLLKVAGFADTTPGFEDFKKGSLEFQLLNEPARSYDNLDFLFRLLLPDSTFASSNVQAVLEELLEDSLPTVREWLDKLMTHVLQAILAKRMKHSKVPDTQSPRAEI